LYPDGRDLGGRAGDTGRCGRRNDTGRFGLRGRRRCCFPGNRRNCPARTAIGTEFCLIGHRLPAFNTKHSFLRTRNRAPTPRRTFSMNPILLKLLRGLLGNDHHVAVQLAAGNCQLVLRPVEGISVDRQVLEVCGPRWRPAFQRLLEQV